MKRCPQCNSVFEDEKAFCTEDGTALVVETFSLPSDFVPEDNDDDEQETILRYKPEGFEISNPSIPEQPEVNPYAPSHANTPEPQKPNRGCFKYGLILGIGSIIGGGLVLAMLGIGYVYLNSQTNGNGNANRKRTIESTPTEKPKPTPQSEKSHTKRNKNADEQKLNGRVIKSRAILRSSPDSGAKRVDRLPRNDRLEIIKRKSKTSKWYQVECEHGSRGWVDGYSIEFTN